jgi:hypothetical protein
VTVPVGRAEAGGPDSTCVAIGPRFVPGAFPSAERLHRRLPMPPMRWQFAFNFKTAETPVGTPVMYDGEAQ